MKFMVKQKKSKAPVAHADTDVISMTGFGHGSASRRGVTVDVEVKSVNGRYLDCNFKLPRQYAGLEPELRDLAGRSVQRGRVEAFISRRAESSSDRGLRFDKRAFQQFAKVYQSAVKELGGKAASAENLAFQLLARREVLDVEDAPEQADEEREVLLEAAAQAFERLGEMRQREGTRLGADMLDRLAHVRHLRSDIAERAANAPAELKSRLTERMRKLLDGAAIDENRLYTEAALLAEKVDISEELVRLDSHFAQFESALRKSPNGKKLDFLLQEIGREFNTIGSKAQDAPVLTLVVEAKTELEKIREQIQNVE